MTKLPCFLKMFWDVKPILAYTTVFSHCCENSVLQFLSAKTPNEAYGDITDVISPFQNCLLCGTIENR